MSKKVIVTDAGIQALINAEESGSSSVVLEKVIISTTGIQASPSSVLSDITDIVSVITSVGGTATSSKSIHVSAVDESDKTYSAKTIGIVTDDGILFAVASSEDGLIYKLDTNQAFIAFDMQLAQGNPENITFGDTNFLNPDATTEIKGIVQLSNEYSPDETKAITPKGLKTVVDNFEKNYVTKDYYKDNMVNGYKIFDVVRKDHLLSYGEDDDFKGLALLGTWVHKDSVPGSRYGYPNFVDKCLEEYDEAEDDVIGTPFDRPNLSANGTLGGNAFAVEASSNVDANWQAFEAVDGATDSNSAWLMAANVKAGWFTFYNPSRLCIRKLNFHNRPYSDTTTVTHGKLWGSDDNLEWTEIKEFWNTTVINGQDWYLDFTENRESFKYHKLEFINSSGIATYSGIGEMTITALENAVKVRKHKNGHIYFDKEDLDTVDAIYAYGGEAWYYGIDKVNERVYLPRSRKVHGTLIKKWSNGTDWYRIYEDGYCEQGGSFGPAYAEYRTRTFTFPKAFKDTNYNVECHSGHTGDLYYPAITSRTVFGVTFVYTYNSTGAGNWSASGYIDMTSLQDSPIYEYMVVGATVQSSQITDVTDVTTTENDTIPLFTAQYFDFTPNNPSWLKGGEQSNSGDLYKTCYNELINILNGETKYGSLKVINTTDLVDGEDYSFYWIVDQINETFKTPTKIEQRFVVKSWQEGEKGYRIYNDGYCEQWGLLSLNEVAAGWNTISFYKQFVDIPHILVSFRNVTADSQWGITYQCNARDVTTSTCSIYIDSNGPHKVWRASGYINLINEVFDTSLYFKVANAVENLQLLDVGNLTEEVSDKIGRRDCKSFVIETYQNGLSGYRVWSDGFCEQWGRLQKVDTSLTITLLKSYKDINYLVLKTSVWTGAANNNSVGQDNTKTVSSFVINGDSRATGFYEYWYTMGYIDLS